MPLSQLGIDEVKVAARDLGVQLIVIGSADLYASRNAKAPARAAVPAHVQSAEAILVKQLIERGATVHYPAVLVYREGQPIGGAILGYKTASAYRGMIEARLQSASPNDRHAIPTTLATPASPTYRVRDASRMDRGGFTEGEPDSAAMMWPTETWKDLAVSKPASPYFRAIPGRAMIVFVADSGVHFLDLTDGSVSRGPGHVDFVPAPDARLFVTPGRDRSGLEFYRGHELLAAVDRGRGRSVRPVFIDRRMPDQYPSVGVLESTARSDTVRAVYRVLTSWLDRAAFRDYEIRAMGGGAEPVVTPRGDPVVACPERRVSTPIISHDGREMAARDEATATTKIFRIADDGACIELLDLGFQTSKVAWDQAGSRIAFAVPPGANPVEGPDFQGILVLDREAKRLSRVPGSELVNRLTFPEFVGRDSIVFLIPAERSDPNRFRVVCCVGR